MAIINGNIADELYIDPAPFVRGLKMSEESRRQFERDWDAVNEKHFGFAKKSIKRYMNGSEVDITHARPRDLYR